MNTQLKGTHSELYFGGRCYRCESWFYGLKMPTVYKFQVLFPFWRGPLPKFIYIFICRNIVDNGINVKISNSIFICWRGRVWINTTYIYFGKISVTVSPYGYLPPLSGNSEISWIKKWIILEVTTIYRFF